MWQYIDDDDNNHSASNDSVMRRLFHVPAWLPLVIFGEGKGTNCVQFWLLFLLSHTETEECRESNQDNRSSRESYSNPSPGSWTVSVQPLVVHENLRHEIYRRCLHVIKNAGFGIQIGERFACRFGHMQIHLNTMFTVTIRDARERFCVLCKVNLLPQGKNWLRRMKLSLNIKTWKACSTWVSVFFDKK
jgi:hypothetical protein